MMEGGSPIDAPHGPGPMVRMCAMPAEHWETHDTWHTSGLRGTGSHHVALTDVLVPDENFFEFPFGTSFAPDPIFAKLPEQLVFSHVAVSVGIAEGALIDLVELARAGFKQMQMTAPLIETERFKKGLARLDADLKAARAARGRGRPRLAKSRASRREGHEPHIGTTASGSLDQRRLRARRGGLFRTRRKQRRVRKLAAATTDAGSSCLGSTHDGPSAPLRDGRDRRARAHGMRGINRSS